MLCSTRISVSLYTSCHLPSGSPIRILSPLLTEKVNSDDESSFTIEGNVGAWKTRTTVDPMLNAATCNVKAR